jgi:hypothetical protein
MRIPDGKRKTNEMPENIIKHPSWPAIFIGVLALFWAFPFCTAADVYRYVDENEITHFTNIARGPRLEIQGGEESLNSDTAPDDIQDPGLAYTGLIARTAKKYGIDSALVKAVIRAESNFDRRAVSRKGARGLMQLMPATALALGVSDCFHPEANIEGGIRHLSRLIGLYNGDLRFALAAYNAGEAAVAKYSGIPPFAETRNYVRQVLDHYARYRRESTISSTASASLKQLLPGRRSSFQ